jgi:zinc protease
MKNILLHEHNEAGEHALHVAPLSKDVTHIRITMPVPSVHRENRMLLPIFAEMLERGSKQYKKDEYEASLESIGASVRIDAESDALGISITVQSPHVPRVLRILEATLSEPTLRAPELAKLKKEVLEAIRELGNDTRHLARALFSRMLYAADHPAYIPTLQDRAILVEAINRQMLQEAHAVLRRAPWLITVAGSQQSYKAVRAIGKTFRRNVTEEAPPIIELPPRLPAQEVEHVAGKQNVELFIGNHVQLLPTDPIFTAFAFGVDVLGKRGGFSGRLMSTVREKEGLTYSIYAWLSGSRSTETGFFNIWTFFIPKDLEKGITSTLREVRKIVEHGISEAELLRFKRLLGNQYTLIFETTSGTVDMFHAALARGLSPSFVLTYPERLATLSRADVHIALKANLDPDRLIIAGAGPVTSLPL